MNSTEDRIADLEKRVDRLVDVLIRVTDILERRLPSEPVYPPSEPRPLGPGHAYAPNLCPTCGIALEKMMSYSCPRAYCPTGMGGVQCLGGK